MASRLQRNGSFIDLKTIKLSQGQKNEAWARQKFFPGSAEKTWDLLLQARHLPGMRVLEIGAGSGIHPQNTNYPIGRVDGTDLDPLVAQNPNISQAWVCDFYQLGEISPNRYDLIYSHMVAEHVDDPLAFLQEQLMLLAPGGVIFHSTLSKWSPPALANWLLPRSIQLWLLRLLRSKRSEAQVYRAYYRMNSFAQLRKIARLLTLEIEPVFVSQPLGYLKFSRRYLGLASGILAPLERMFPQLRSQLVVFIRRGSN